MAGSFMSVYISLLKIYDKVGCMDRYDHIGCTCTNAKYILTTFHRTLLCGPDWENTNSGWHCNNPHTSIELGG